LAHTHWQTELSNQLPTVQGRDWHTQAWLTQAFVVLLNGEQVWQAAPPAPQALVEVPPLQVPFEQQPAHVRALHW
jgi:hypothetical protein